MYMVKQDAVKRIDDFIKELRRQTNKWFIILIFSLFLFTTFSVIVLLFDSGFFVSAKLLNNFLWIIFWFVVITEATIRLILPAFKKDVIEEKKREEELKNKILKEINGRRRK